MRTDDEIIDIVQNEGDPTLRRVAFQCVSDIDGKTVQAGLTWSGSQLKESKNFVESNFTGAVSEIGAGWYMYQFATAFLTDLGALTLRPSRSGVLSKMTLVANVVGTPGVDPALGDAASHSGPHVGLIIGL